MSDARFHGVAILLVALAGGCGGRESDSAQSRAAGPLFAHPGSCRQCHDVAPGAVPTDHPTAARCSATGCHGAFLTAAKFQHAPAVMDRCERCHVPHASPQQKLLAREELLLCGSCHDHLITCPFPGLADPRACSNCHETHGSGRPYLLREDLAMRPAAVNHR